MPVSPTSNDGWGELENGILGGPDDDKDGWDDIEPQEEPKPSPFLANIQAAQRRPVSQPKPQGNDNTFKMCVPLEAMLLGSSLLLLELLIILSVAID